MRAYSGYEKIKEYPRDVTKKWRKHCKCYYIICTYTLHKGTNTQRCGKWNWSGVQQDMTCFSIVYTFIYTTRMGGGIKYTQNVILILKNRESGNAHKIKEPERERDFNKKKNGRYEGNSKNRMKLAQSSERTHSHTHTYWVSVHVVKWIFFLVFVRRSCNNSMMCETCTLNYWKFNFSAWRRHVSVINVEMCAACKRYDWT